MKIVKSKAKHLKIKVPPNSNVPVESPVDAFKHHGIHVYVGKRGAGKSTAVCSYLNMLKKAGCADRILCISSTLGSNMALMDSLSVDVDNDVFDPDDVNVVEKYRAILDSERDEYVSDLNKMSRYKEFISLYSSADNIYNIPDETLLEFTDEEGNLLPAPKLKYGHRPCIHIWVDDAQSTPIFGNRKFLNSVIKHRHESAMPYKRGDKKFCGAIGCSMYICVQNYTSTHNGIPRAVRNNATVLVVVGKSQDKKELQNIYSSVAGEISEEDFFKAYTYATNEQHGSFWIDLHPKPEHPSRFRKNLNEYILLE